MRKCLGSNPVSWTLTVTLFQSSEDGVDMEISITAITRNRKFSKSLTRHAQALEPIKFLAIDVDTSKLSFDVLQLAFLDRSEDYVHPVGCKSDRLFQVEVPIPGEHTLDFGDAPAFARAVAQRLSLA
jgi:hypothetical protein